MQKISQVLQYVDWTNNVMRSNFGPHNTKVSGFFVAHYERGASLAAAAGKMQHARKPLQAKMIPKPLMMHLIWEEVKIAHYVLVSLLDHGDNTERARL